MGRSRNGDGNIRQIRPGVWRVEVSLGRDPATGRYRRRSVTVTGTERDALEARARLVVDAIDGKLTASPSNRRTVDLLERWYAHACPDLSPSTRAGYRSKLDQYLIPELGHIALRALDVATIDGAYTRLRQRGLAPATIHNAHRVLHRALTQAVRWGWLPSNPADLASPPRPSGQVPEPPGPDVVARLIATAPPDLAELARLAVITGARRGTLCGLHWSDIDWQAGTLKIARSIVESADGTLHVRDGGKTGKTHMLSLDGVTLNVLRARRTRKRAEALTIGVTIGPDGYLFADEPDGNQPLRPMLVTSRWRRHMALQGVSCRFHDLRHFAVTHMLAHGIPVRDVAERVGHSSARMTLDVYGHPVPTSDLRAADILATALDGT